MYLRLKTALPAASSLGMLLPGSIFCKCLYPAGESYMDVIQRTEPVITEVRPGVCQSAIH
eukprot:scaffold43344_cov19-Tisochrysis_lutea.AAC.4